MNEYVLDELCKKHGLTYEIRFGTVYIYTRYETFYFEINNKKKTKLMHKGRCGDHREYHLQFEKEIELEDLLIYIKEHTEAKYTTNYVRYSVVV